MAINIPTVGQLPRRPSLIEGAAPLFPLVEMFLKRKMEKEDEDIANKALADLASEQEATGAKAQGLEAPTSPKAVPRVTKGVAEDTTKSILEQKLAPKEPKRPYALGQLVKRSYGGTQIEAPVEGYDTKNQPIWGEAEEVPMTARTSEGMAQKTRFLDIDAKLQADPDSVSDEDKNFHQAYINERGLTAKAYGNAKLKSQLSEVYDLESQSTKKITNEEYTKNPDRYITTKDPAFQLLVPTSGLKTMKQAVPTVKHFIKETRDAMKDVSMGPLAGRWKEAWAGGVGADDPAYIRLRTATKLLSSRLMQMHVGSRPAEKMQEHFESLVNSGKLSKANMESALNEIEKYADEIKSTNVADYAELPTVKTFATRRKQSKEQYNPAPTEQKADFSTMSDDDLLKGF